MSPTSDLKSLYERFQARQIATLAIFDSVHAAWRADRKRFPEFDRLTTYCCMATVNDWAEFSRSYVLSCIKSPTRISGPPVAYANVAVNTDIAVLELACRKCRNRKVTAPARHEEPKWHRLRTVRDTLHELQVSHLPDVDAAQTHRPDDLSALFEIRNYFAHRNLDSKAIALGYSLRYLVPKPLHPTHLLASSSGRTGGLPILNFLVEGLIETAELMCT